MKAKGKMSTDMEKSESTGLTVNEMCLNRVENNLLTRTMLGPRADRVLKIQTEN